MEAEQTFDILEKMLDTKLKPLYEDIAGIKNDLSDAKQEIKSLHNKFDLSVSEQPGDTLAMLQLMNAKLDHIQKDVAFIHYKTSQNELEINRLKR